MDYNKTLVDKAREGDASAVEKLVEYYTPLFISLTRRYARPNSDLYDDILQDCKVVFLRVIAEYDPEKSMFGYYAKKSLEANISNIVRSRYFVPECSIDPDGYETYMDDNDVFGRIDLHNAISKAVESLPPNQKLAIKLYFYIDMRQEECAAHMQIGQSAFSRLLNRGLEKVRKSLGECNM